MGREVLKMVVQGEVKQQARARVTRALVLDAAATEFAARGYAAASLATILTASGRTKAPCIFISRPRKRSYELS